jgi:hypothetical protein
MMCRCDEEFGRKYLPHQLDNGTDLNTKTSYIVTHGFQDTICNECRGLLPTSAPKAEIYGRTSKLKRYYWREIGFETIRLFAQWCSEQGYDWLSLQLVYREEYKHCEQEATNKIRELHEVNPKYT